MIDPVVYVVRHPEGYALYPFSERISELLQSGALEPAAVLAAVRYLDVSLIVSADGGEVLWRAGSELTLEELEGMAVFPVGKRE
jgi:hypothetical protein